MERKSEREKEIWLSWRGERRTIGGIRLYRKREDERMFKQCWQRQAQEADGCGAGE